MTNNSLTFTARSFQGTIYNFIIDRGLFARNFIAIRQLYFYQNSLYYEFAYVAKSFAYKFLNYPINLGDIDLKSEIEI